MAGAVESFDQCRSIAPCLEEAASHSAPSVSVSLIGRGAWFQSRGRRLEGSFYGECCEGEGGLDGGGRVRLKLKGPLQDGPHI